MTATLEAVTGLIARDRREPAVRIRPSTRLREDLGLDGDDVEPFLKAFAAQFSVDLSGFEFRRHFRDEPTLISPILWLCEGWRHRRWRTQPVTIEHLVRVVEAGRWIDPH